MASSYGKILKDGLLVENPIFRQVLGICSALAVTNLVVNTLFMGFGVTFATALTAFTVSLLRNYIPTRIRMIVQVVIIACYVMMIDILIKAVAPGKEGVGFVAGGMGFWDRIECVVVLSPDLRNVLNVQVLDQKETPGLGARIEEPWFTDQFKGLALAWEAPAESRILVGANPAPNAPNEVDAITGATQTSMALMRFLNDELALIRPLFAPNREPLNPEPLPPLP